MIVYAYDIHSDKDNHLTAVFHMGIMYLEALCLKSFSDIVFIVEKVIMTLQTCLLQC